VPDALERLLVVPAGPRRIADDARVEPAAAGQRQAEGDELRPPVPRIPAKVRGAEHGPDAADAVRIHGSAIVGQRDTVQPHGGEARGHRPGGVGADRAV